MTNLHPAFFDKIANPDLALAALHNNELHGEFKALVRLARPDKRPSGVKVMEIHSADVIKVRIRCDQIEHFVEDGNVLRIELSEYISNGAAGTAD
jgi:hypothetical protein